MAVLSRAPRALAGRRVAPSSPLLQQRRHATAPAAASGSSPLVLDERRQGLLGRTFMDYMPQSAFEANPLVLERAKGLYYWDVTGKVRISTTLRAVWLLAASPNPVAAPQRPCSH